MTALNALSIEQRLPAMAALIHQDIPGLLTAQTTTTPNKTSIMARIRALISTATSGLPKSDAAHLVCILFQFCHPSQARVSQLVMAG